MTIAAESVIHTLHGDKFVIDLLDSNKPIYTFCRTNNRITVGVIKIERLVVTLPIEFILDDGALVIAGRDSTVVMRDDTTKVVTTVKSGESFMPLYKGIDCEGYPAYSQMGDWHKGGLTIRDKKRTRRILRMVAEWKLGRRCKPGDSVHHIDGNRLNCNPDNLKLQFKEQIKERKQRSKFAEAVIEGQKILNEHKKHKKNNHKLVSACETQSREMFVITGVNTPNFAVNGIFLSTDNNSQ